MRGTVGGLHYWANQTAIDNENDLLYVVGLPDSAGWTRYTLNAPTGALLQQVALTIDAAPLREALGTMVNSRGEVLAFRWNDVAAEALLRLDPSTGEATILGEVGDLELWSGVACWNPSSDEIDVLGIVENDDGSTDDKLYALDGLSGALLYELPVADWPTTAVLAF